MSYDKSLEERIEQLEILITNFVEQDREAQSTQFEKSCRESAQVAALHSLVRELCLQAGITQEECLQHFEMRVEHYFDIFFQKHRQGDSHVKLRSAIEAFGGDVQSRIFTPLFPVHDSSRSGVDVVAASL